MSITINKIRSVGYTTLVDYNDGEGQLVITGSYGQHGGLVHTVLDAEVDGGLRTLAAVKDLPYDEACQRIRTVLLRKLKDEDQVSRVMGFIQGR